MKNLIQEFGIMTTKTFDGYKETVYLTKTEEWKEEAQLDPIEDIMTFETEKEAFDFLASKNWDRPEPFKVSELL